MDQIFCVIKGNTAMTCAIRKNKNCGPNKSVCAALVRLVIEVADRTSFF